MSLSEHHVDGSENVIWKCNRVSALISQLDKISFQGPTSFDNNSYNFHTRLGFCVPCPFKHSMHHSLSFISLQSLHGVNVINCIYAHDIHSWQRIDQHMYGKRKENSCIRVLCLSWRLHAEVSGEKRAFTFVMHQSLVSTVNCAVQIRESRASNRSSFAYKEG